MKSKLASGCKRSVLFVASSLILVAGPSSGTGRDRQGWPVVALPQGTTTYSVADRIIANGIPLQIKGFAAKSAPHAMAKWFRGLLGEPIVEKNLGKIRILGKATNGYFITIQMSPAGTGTNGTLTVSHLRAAYESRDKTQAALSRLLARLPAGSKIDTEMVSIDGSKLSKYYVLSNSHTDELNRDRIRALMREDGMRLQYQGSITEGKMTKRIPSLSKNGRMLFFQGEKKEAIAVIGRNTEGVTVVQVNVVSETGM